MRCIVGIEQVGKTKEQLKQVIYAIAAAAACLFAYKLFFNPIRNMFPSQILGFFIARLLFAMLVPIAMVVIRRRDVLEADWSALKQGWTAAGFEIALILFYLWGGSGALPESEAYWWEWILLILFAFLVGYCEETLFRGFVLKALLRYFGEESRTSVLISLLLSGLIFGISHISNVFENGVTLSGALYQAAVTAAHGVYLGAIFYRTKKNMWFNAILHGIYDLVGIIQLGILRHGDTVQFTPAASPRSIITILVWTLLFLGSTLIVLRPGKLDPLLQKPAAKTTE